MLRPGLIERFFYVLLISPHVDKGCHAEGKKNNKKKKKAANEEGDPEKEAEKKKKEESRKIKAAAKKAGNEQHEFIHVSTAWC